MALNIFGTTSYADESHIDFTYICVNEELLQNYETYSNLHAATEDMHNLRQKHDQKAQKCCERLIHEANRLGRAFDP